jgi:hypothetical protein
LWWIAEKLVDLFRLCRAGKGAGRVMSKSTYEGSSPARKVVVALVVAVALALVVLMVLQLASSRPAYAASDVLPDLGMAHPQDLRIRSTADGRRLLRFSSIVVNVGAGPFEVRGQRPDTNTSTMTVTQRIFDDAGGSRYVPTPATMYFGGDGHNHWHVTNLEDFELERLDNGKLVGTGAKHGFCFYDNYRYGATGDPSYLTTTTPPACGRSSSLEVFEGLSVGWGDIYRYNLPDQYIDITGLVSGRYQLISTADPDNWFQESNDLNNESWVNLQIKGSKVSVVRYGPSA